MEYRPVAYCAEKNALLEVWLECVSRHADILTALSKTTAREEQIALGRSLQAYKACEVAKAAYDQHRQAHGC